MTIVETFIQLRDDIRAWVVNNLNAKENIFNKTTEINADSTDDQYPSAKAVWDVTKNAGGAVSSVNGKTGTVELSASDVGATAEDEVENMINSSHSAVVFPRLREIELSLEGKANTSDTYTKGEVDALIVSGGDANSFSSIVLNSSTEGSSKQFKITIDDNGILTATAVEVNE